MAEKKLTRRDILKLSGLGAAALATAGIAGKARAAKTAVEKTIAPRRLAMVIDLDKCTGCHACSVACKAEFNIPLGVWKSWVKIGEKGTFPHTGRYFLPRLCNHCTEAPCVTICPTKASYIREDGIVMIDDKKCIACKSCRAVCPYDSRFTHPIKKTADKCDFCLHRVDEGVVPACVNTCPAQARIFGDLNDPDSEVSKLIASNSVQQLKPELGTKPNVFYIGADEEAMRLYGGGDRS